LKPTILQLNASPVYRFLSILKASLDEGDVLEGKKILDCGAGGPIPPLAIFAEQGLDTCGIDISPTQVERSRAFCSKVGLSMELVEGDMRALPFDDTVFDYVYEHYSMCHLSKAHTAAAIGEMYRVLKPGGIAFLGVVSQDCWPLSAYGEEKAPGERWMTEDGRLVCHSLFTDREADALVSAWDVAWKERIVLHIGSGSVTKEQWMDLYAEAPTPCALDDWSRLYSDRHNVYRYVHIYYFLNKPESGSDDPL
jgi:SAM-dependent methyltransferase